MWKAVLVLLALALAPLSADAQTNGVGKDGAGRTDATNSQRKLVQNPPPALPVAIQNAIERIPAALEAANTKQPSPADESRAERDVRAQEELAWWGWPMFAVGVAGVLLTGVGVVLLYMTLQETKAAASGVAEELDVARKTYVAANRPRLRVRKLRMEPPETGKPLVFRCELINVGDTRARIVEEEITVSIPMSRAYRLYVEGKKEQVLTRQFKTAGEVAQGEALLARYEMMPFDQDWGFEGPGWWETRLRISGTIRYMDDNGVTRRTAFFREATGDLNRFIMPNIGPDAAFDLEYED